MVLVSESAKSFDERFPCCCRSQADWKVTYYLHDAVYLYLRTVNWTLAEGDSDHRDGRLIHDRIIGQRFAGRFPTITFVSRRSGCC